MEKSRLTCRQIEKEIHCPLKPEKCKLVEGSTRSNKMISHNAIIFTSIYNFCEKGTSFMGDRNDNP